jgi:hypothetical protein
VSLVSPPFTRALYDRLPEGFPAQLVDGMLLHDPSPLRGHQALVGVLYIAVVRLAVWDAPPPLDRREAEVPAVVFEVLSPSNRRLDREVKAGKFLAAGVLEVWLVDPDRESVEIRTREGRRVHRGPDVARSAAIEGFTVVPADLFESLRS